MKNIDLNKEAQNIQINKHTIRIYGLLISFLMLSASYVMLSFIFILAVWYFSRELEYSQVNQVVFEFCQYNSNFKYREGVSSAGSKFYIQKRIWK